MNSADLDALIARLRQAAMVQHSFDDEECSLRHLCDDAAAALAALRADAERYREAELALGDAARELPQVAGTVAHRIRVYRQSYSEQIAALRADAGAMEVLRELVRLKGIKENLEVYETGSAAERIEWARDYNKNKPLAWNRARTLLDAAREAKP